MIIFCLEMVRKIIKSLGILAENRENRGERWFWFFCFVCCGFCLILWVGFCRSFTDGGSEVFLISGFGLVGSERGVLNASFGRIVV